MANSMPSADICREIPSRDRLTSRIINEAKESKEEKSAISRGNIKSSKVGERNVERSEVKKI